jgi:hypothetical protein
VFLHQPETASLTLSQDSVKQFCRTLLARQVPAWQRLQAVRAIELYRSQVLGTSDPDLLEIRQMLGRKAEGDRVAVMTSQDEAELVGVINTTDPLWIQKNLERDLEFIDAVRAQHPKHLPLVLSRQEVNQVL